MDERRGIRIPDVRLIPDVTKVAIFEVARHERGLAGAGRGANPDDRPRRGFVEKRKQPRPRQRIVELRPRQFGESGRAGGHEKEGQTRLLDDSAKS